MKNAIFISLILFLASCATIDDSINSTYWVNSYKVDCEGVAPMSCLQVQNGETIEEGQWQNFYATINDFNFEAGYIYKLKVKEENLVDVPADASSIKYTLMKVLEKKIDERFAVNDIWLAETINGKPLSATENPVQLEIQVAGMKVMGIDGCNNFMGDLTRLSNSEIEFGPIAGTRRMCAEMATSDAFNQNMGHVKKYKVANMKLTFFDESDQELIVFKKVD